MTCLNIIEKIILIKKRPEILQVRKTPLPLLKKRSKLRTLSSDAPDLTKSPYNKLGAMYKVGNGIIGHPDNIGNNGIIDISSLLNDRKTSKFINNTKINNTRLEISTYSSEDDFSEIINRKVNYDGAVRFDGFGVKASLESTYKNVFHSITHENNKTFKGGLDLIYDAQRIEINNTDLTFKTIGYRNLDDSFLYSLCMEKIDNFLDENGVFIISKLYTGARLSVLYLANSESNTHKEIDSVDFRISMKASLKWFKLGDKPGLELGFASKSDKTNETIKKYSDFRCFMQTFGGTPRFQPPSNILDLTTSNIIDFGEWYKSLSDESNHVIVDIGDKGLVPISKFILEENYRDMINKYINSNGAVRFPHNIEPSVDMVRLRYEGSRYEPDEAIFLINTRHGEKIFIKPYNSVWDGYKYSEEYNKLFSNISSIFNCKITGNNYFWLGAPSSYNEDMIDEYKMINFNFFSDKIFKFKNPYSNIYYIYDTNSKVAFSYYEDDDDENYITDLYGITDWVDGLIEKKVSMSALINNYKIIGL